MKLSSHEKVHTLGPRGEKTEGLSANALSGPGYDVTGQVIHMFVKTYNYCTTPQTKYYGKHI